MKDRRVTIEHMMTNTFEPLDEAVAKDLLYTPVDQKGLPDDVRSLWDLLKHAQKQLDMAVDLINQRLQTSTMARHTEEHLKQSKTRGQSREVRLMVLPTGDVVCFRGSQLAPRSKSALVAQGLECGYDMEVFGQKTRLMETFLEMIVEGQIEKAEALYHKHQGKRPVKEPTGKGGPAIKRKQPATVDAPEVMAPPKPLNEPSPPLNGKPQVSKAHKVEELHDGLEGLMDILGDENRASLLPGPNDPEDQDDPQESVRADEARTDPDFNLSEMVHMLSGVHDGAENPWEKRQPKNPWEDPDLPGSDEEWEGMDEHTG